MKKLEIEVGQKFGDWTVIDTNIPSKDGHSMVRCLCKCGNIRDIYSTELNKGKTSSCRSCAARKRTPLLNIGDKYKHWTVIGGPIYKGQNSYYTVQCDCGTVIDMTHATIVHPIRSLMCRKCAHKENMENLVNKNGAVGEVTYKIWKHFKYSAEKRNIPFDVTIEYLWNLFLSLNKCCAITGDKLESVAESSLDRIDSSKGYIEGNVQWVTTQANLSKHIMTMDQLYEFCRKVLNHANQQPSVPLTKHEGSETNN